MADKKEPSSPLLYDADEKPPQLTRNQYSWDEHVTEFLLNDKKRPLGVIAFFLITFIILLIISLTVVDSKPFTVIMSILVAITGVIFILWVGNMVWIKHGDQIMNKLDRSE